jgi:3-phenylpropionate/trans-cinnamate dioxygenase ferredoxin subunit
MANFIKVAEVGDLEPGKALEVDVDGTMVCLAVTADGALYALRNNCSHKDFPLTDGEVEDSTIECAWHGARFDLATGEPLSLPAIRPVKTYEVRVDGDDILIDAS